MASVTRIIPLAFDEADRFEQAGMLRRSRYIGFRAGQRCQVWACTLQGVTLLHPRSDLIKLVPVEFNWGDTASGAAHLALAVLSHWAGGDKFALRYYQAFAADIIAHFAQSTWELTTSQIANSIARMKFTRKEEETKQRL
jgi:hypothetical protein